MSLDICREGSFQRPPPLLPFVKNVSLLNPSFEPACTGGGGYTLDDSPRIGQGIHPWIAEVPLLEKNLYRHLA